MHRAALRDNWLCWGGERFLETFYRTAAELDSVLLLTERDAEGLVGFLLASTQPRDALRLAVGRIGRSLLAHPAALLLWLARHARQRLAGAEQVTWDAEILFLAVRAELRRRGYGRRLMARALNELRHRGARDIVLRLSPSNAVASAFYRAAGFERLKKGFGKWIFRKTL